MNYKDVTIGMKVVVHNKSIGCSLMNSPTYKNMKSKEQPFLYVTHQHAGDRMNSVDRFMLSDDEREI